MLKRIISIANIYAQNYQSNRDNNHFQFFSFQPLKACFNTVLLPIFCFYRMANRTKTENKIHCYKLCFDIVVWYHFFQKQIGRKKPQTVIRKKIIRNLVPFGHSLKTPINLTPEWSQGNKHNILNNEAQFDLVYNTVQLSPVH